MRACAEPAFHTCKLPSQHGGDGPGRTHPVANPHLAMKTCPLRFFLGVLGAALLASAPAAWSAEEIAPNRKPVKGVGDQRLEVRTAAGAGTLVFYA